MPSPDKCVIYTDAKQDESLLGSAVDFGRYAWDGVWDVGEQLRDRAVNAGFEIVYVTLGGALETYRLARALPRDVGAKALALARRQPEPVETAYAEAD